MDWFGLTMLGVSDPIKFSLRKDYKEPTKQLTVYEEIALGSKKHFSELLSEVDVYIGRIDGHAYKSFDRFTKMRKKGVVPPQGPTDKYRYPITDAQNFSFWKTDPVLKETDWYKQSKYKPKLVTEITKVVDLALKVDKNAKL